MQWYLEVLKKYAQFSGRARRKEFWFFILITTLIALGLAVLDEVTGLNQATNRLSPLYSLYALAVAIPGLAVCVRRLHDIGKSGWWLLIALVPIAGLILLLFYVRPGNPGANEYGEDPTLALADQ
jgi:uncharacterized membrane protein YhaH (DUF805 family)